LRFASAPTTKNNASSYFLGGMMKNALLSKFIPKLVTLCLSTTLLLPSLHSSAYAAENSASNNANEQCLSCAPSKASNASLKNASAGLGVLVAGSAMLVSGTGMYVVHSVQQVGEVSVLVLKSSAEGVSTTIELSGKGIKELALVSGAIIQTSATATGHVLMFSGQIIAFIPNQIGMALIHHEKVK
jgi:hypothetical protein